MKKAKQVNNLSRRARATARKILADSKGRMALAELERRVEKSLGTQLRSDFFKGALSSRGSGLEVYQGVVILTREPQKGGNRKVRGAKKEGAKRLTPEEFILLAVEKLPKPGYRGVHSVYSGLNSAFRKYFPGLDPVTEVDKLVAQGKVSIRPIKGGVLIFKGDTLPPSGAEAALDKMGL